MRVRGLENANLEMYSCMFMKRNVLILCDTLRVGSTAARRTRYAARDRATRPQY